METHRDRRIDLPPQISGSVHWAADSTLKNALPLGDWFLMKIPTKPSKLFCHSSEFVFAAWWTKRFVGIFRLGFSILKSRPQFKMRDVLTLKSFKQFYLPWPFARQNHDSFFTLD